MGYRLPQLWPSDPPITTEIGRVYAFRGRRLYPDGIVSRGATERYSPRSENSTERQHALSGHRSTTDSVGLVTEDGDPSCVCYPQTRMHDDRRRGILNVWGYSVKLNHMQRTHFFEPSSRGVVRATNRPTSFPQRKRRLLSGRRVKYSNASTGECVCVGPLYVGSAHAFSDTQLYDCLLTRDTSALAPDVGQSISVRRSD